MRDALRQLFVDTLGALDVKRNMRLYCDRIRTWAEAEPMLVIGLGKAARPMAQTLVEEFPKARMRGLIVPPEPDGAPLPPFEVIAGGHPLPSAGSLQAATRALELARSARPEEHTLFLISGGGSAMFELPADPTVTLDELRELYRALVGCGGNIVEINTVRRWLSAVKGGRLALAVSSRQTQRTVVISDVPDEDIYSLASIPTSCDRSAIADCRAILDRYELWSSVPAALRARLDNGDLPEPMRPADELEQRSEYWKLLSNQQARTALTEKAERVGIRVVTDQSVDDLPHDVAATRLLAQLNEARLRFPDGSTGVLTGGEVTVKLPPDPGTGGRNQQFALECALRIEGQPITVLSAGTDGIDGNSPAAGAVADGTTAARARALGLDPVDHLRRFDAHPLFEALGDTVTTGPSGQNVRDLRLLVRTP